MNRTGLASGTPGPLYARAQLHKRPMISLSTSCGAGGASAAGAAGCCLLCTPGTAKTYYGRAELDRKLTQRTRQLDSALLRIHDFPGIARTTVSLMTVDTDLMRWDAATQGRPWASRDKLDHNVVRSFNERLRGQGYRAKAARKIIGAGSPPSRKASRAGADSPATSSKPVLAGGKPHGHCSRVWPTRKYKVFWRLFSKPPDEPARLNPG